MIGFLVVVTASIVWISVLVKIDENRKYKELTKEVVIFFIFGFIFSGIAYFVENWVGKFMDLFLGESGFFRFVFSWMFVGFFEEAVKFSITFVVLSGRRKIWEPKDIMIFAGAVSLGFATLENMYYNLFVSVNIIGLRSVISVVGHISYSSIWAVGIIIYLFNFYGEKRGKSLLLFSFLAAGLTHAIYDFLIELDFVSLSLAFVWDALVFIGAVYMFDAVVKESPYRRFRLSEADTAIEKIEKSLAVNRSNYLLNRKITIFYLYMGMFDRALRALRVCLKQRPKDFYIRFYIALLLYIVNPEDDARLRRLVGVAAEIDSVNPRILKVLEREVLRVLRESPFIDERVADRVAWVFSQFDPKSLVYGLYKMAGR